MRLSRDKIEYLALRVLKLIQDEKELHILSTPDILARAVEDTIYDNMQQEQEIEDEVDVLLGQHRGEIEAMEMDVGLLRAKIKREVAKKRGFVL